MPDNIHIPQERHIALEVREAMNSLAVAAELQGLRQALGPENPLSLGDMAHTEAQLKLTEAHGKTVFNDFRDLRRYYELRGRMKSLQLFALPQKTAASEKELVLANRQITYNEYLPALVDQLIGTMDLYEEDIRDILPSLPPEQRKKAEEDRLRIADYLQALKLVMQERTKLASIFKMDVRLMDLQAKPTMKDELDRLTKVKDHVFATLRPQSREAYAAYAAGAKAYGEEKDPTKKAEIFRASDEAYQSYLTGLEDEFIDIMKGNPDDKPIAGAPKDFLPQRAYIALLQSRYTQIRAIQSDIARTSGFDLDTKKAAQTELGPIRRDALKRLVTLTQHLAAHQLSMAELASIQEQFGPALHPDGFVALPFSAVSPDTIHAKAEASLEGTTNKPGAKQFHLERLQTMLRTVDTAFSPNGIESLTDAAAMKFVRNLDEFSKSIRSLLTGFLPDTPETKALNAWFDETLPLSIQESLESGVTADGKPATKEEKLGLMRDVLLKLRDSGSIKRFMSTLAVLRAMPPSSTFVGQEVQQDVLTRLSGQRFDSDPTGRTADVDGRDVVINGATAYALLLRQMKNDGEAFQTDYCEFLDNMDRLVDLRLGLAAETNAIAQSWRNVGVGLSALAGGTLVFTAVSPFLLTYGPTWMAEGVTVANRALRAGVRTPVTLALPLQTARTYLDYVRYRETKLELRRVRARLMAELRAAGFEADPPDQADRCTYDHDGVKVTISLNDIDNALQGQATVDFLRTGADIGEAAYLAYSTYKQTRLVRALSVLVAVDVAVETVIYAADQRANRNFIEQCPAWLLAKINLETAIAERPSAVLATASEWMITDLLRPFHATENKEEMREKMIFSMLHEELRDFPDLAAMLYPAGTHGTSLDAFFKGDFKDVFLKFFSARILKSSEGRLSFDQAKKSDVAGFSVLPFNTPDVAELRVREAVREAALLTALHESELTYRRALRARTEYKKVEPQHPAIAAALEEQVRVAGEAQVFGVKLADSDIDTSEETRIQRLADQLPSSTQAGRFIIPKSDIPGMPADVDFSDASRTFSTALPDSPMVIRLREMKPRTVGEDREAQDEREYPGTMYHLRPVSRKLAETLQRSVRDQTLLGAYKYVDIERSYALGAADNIRRELSGKKKLLPDPSLAGAFLGASPDEASASAGRESITEDGIAFIESGKRVPETRKAIRRSVELEEAAAERKLSDVLVYASGIDDESFTMARRLLSSEAVSPSTQKEVGPLLAVFFEARRLPQTNHQIVLATFVYGNAETAEYSVAQQAAATSALARFGRQSVDGAIRFVGEGALSRKPGLKEILDVTTLKVRVRHAANAKAAKERAVQAGIDRRAWEADRPERDAKVRERVKVREQTLEKSARGTKFAYVPGLYTRDEANNVFVEQPGTFHRIIDGYDVTLPIEPYPVRPSFRAGVPKGVLPARKLTFTAERGGTITTYVADLQTLIEPPTNFTKDDIALVEAVLTADIDVTGHPNAADRSFLEHVNREQIGNILSTVSFGPSHRKTAAEIKSDLVNEMTTLLAALPAERRVAFKHALVESLKKHATAGPVTWTRFSWGNYGKILDDMKAAAR